jgi:hypothetical protein
MEHHSTAKSTEEALIRESMEFKEDEELLEIYELRGTDTWTEKAYEIAREILMERGIQVNDEEVSPALSDFADNNLEKKDGEEKLPSLDLSRVNWQEDSIEAIYYNLCKRNIALLDSGSQHINTKPVVVEKEQFNCTNCDESISWQETRCPYCGLELFPELPIEEATVGEEGDSANSEEDSELLNELRGLTNEELLGTWFESDPMEWEAANMTAWRTAFAERKLQPMYILDAPADVMKRIPYLTEEGLALRGFPGYRFRPGRCGLDKIESEAEFAHMQGVFIHYLLTFQLRTTNLLYIFVMLFLAGFCLAPMGFFLFGSGAQGLLFLPMIAIGVLLVINVIYSFLDIINGNNEMEEHPVVWPPRD